MGCHLQFVDDIVFFSRASLEELLSLKLILLVFGRLLGLRMNLNKYYKINIFEDELYFSSMKWGWRSCRGAAEVEGMSVRGGSCWFAVESKSFDISIEVVVGKLRGIIEERERGFSS